MLQAKKNVAALFARVALSASFLSAVADRFGWWGPPGAPQVAWGDFSHFTTYTALLDPLVPNALIGLLARLATLAEVAAGVLLLIGLFSRAAAAAAAGLLIVFFLTMASTLGVKTPLDYSVLSAASASLLLVLLGPGQWSLDELRKSPIDRISSR